MSWLAWGAMVVFGLFEYAFLPPFAHKLLVGLTWSAVVLHKDGRPDEAVVIEMTTPGSGGFGPPAARDRAAIGRDLLDGYVSTASAQHDYGIADPQVLRKAAETEDGA